MHVARDPAGNDSFRCAVSGGASRNLRAHAGCGAYPGWN